MSQLRVATERVELAHGTAEMDRAIAERADAVQRVSTMIACKTRAFSSADLTELQQLYVRGATILTDLQRARQNYCVSGAKLDGMQHVLSSFRLNN